jgi:hypothetical protein
MNALPRIATLAAAALLAASSVAYAANGGKGGNNGGNGGNANKNGRGHNATELWLDRENGCAVGNTPPPGANCTGRDTN